MNAPRIRLWAFGVALTASLTGCSSQFEPSVVVKIVRTVNTNETISSQDYERLRELTDSVLQHVQGVDESIRPQLSLSSQRNFIDEIGDQTRSGFGPDLLITDSETALELYRKKLIDPITLTSEERADTPPHLLELATARDGQLVGRPVNQFIQLACYNKSKLPSPPTTLKAMEESSSDNTFGMALQLKDLFWSAESFDAGAAMQAALDKKTPKPERQKKVTNWLRWLESASYQQNIRFLNDQRRLREGLIAGEIDWITCWSSSLRELRDKMKDQLGVAPLPTGPSKRMKATTKLQVWSLGRNSSAAQRKKALVMIDFISKPWAQKTYSMASRTSMPVNRQAAKIVANKIPGGKQTLVMYANEALKANAAKGQAKARVFRDPEKYETISDALLNTVYDIRSPEESTQDILKSLRESNK